MSDEDKTYTVRQIDKDHGYVLKNGGRVITFDWASHRRTS